MHINIHVVSLSCCAPFCTALSGDYTKNRKKSLGATIAFLKLATGPFAVSLTSKETLYEKYRAPRWKNRGDQSTQRRCPIPWVEQPLVMQSPVDGHFYCHNKTSSPNVHTENSPSSPHVPLPCVHWWHITFPRRLTPHWVWPTASTRSPNNLRNRLTTCMRPYKNEARPSHGALLPNTEEQCLPVGQKRDGG